MKINGGPNCFVTKTFVNGTIAFQEISMPTPHKEYLLSIDNGTQSVRAMLFDSEGSLIAKQSVPIEPYFSLQLGWAEQHSEYFWSALCNACQGLWHQLEDQKDRIAALSITTQRATAVALDEAFRPIRPTFSWLDQRKVNTQPALTTFESLVTRLLGLRPAVQSFHQKAESNWIAQMEPELWDKIQGASPDSLRNIAKGKLKMLKGFFESGRIGMLIDGTGGNYEKMVRQKETAEALGYDTMLLFVDTSSLEYLSSHRTCILIFQRRTAIFILVFQFP